MDELDSRVAVLENNYARLQEIVIEEKRRLNGNLEKIDTRLVGLGEKLDAVKTEALQKPSWGTALAITALASALSGIVVYVLAR